MEWTPPLEELGSLVLNFSELVPIGWYYQTTLHVITILHLYSFLKILLGTWILIGFSFDILIHHKELGKVTISLSHGEGIGQGGCLLYTSPSPRDS